MNAPLYLYAVVDRPDEQSLGPIGVGSPPGEVRVLAVHGVGVVVSETTEARFSPAGPDVATHQAVLGRLMEWYTVLPFRFGTVADGRAAVETLVSSAADDLRDRLRRLAGRVEVGVKVFWRKEEMRRAALAAAGIRGALPLDAPQEERYAEAIRVGQAVEHIAGQWRERYVPRIAAALTAHSEELREGPPVATAMLWNASFLVRRERLARFREAVDELDRRLGDYLDFRYVAPLPPYSFVDLRWRPDEEVQA